MYNLISRIKNMKGLKEMKVIKRDGHMVEYMPSKIEEAIEKANLEVDEEDRASSTQIKNIIKYVERLGKKRILVEDIQDIIEMKLMSIGKFALAKHYITYRYTRELVRRSNTTDHSIKELIDGGSEYWTVAVVPLGDVGRGAFPVRRLQKGGDGARHCRARGARGDRVG